MLNIANHPAITSVPNDGGMHAGKLCLRDIEGPLDVELWQYMPRMAERKGGDGVMLAVTNAWRRWWHHRVPGLYYDTASGYSFVGPSKAFTEVIALFIQEYKILPKFELIHPPDEVKKHWNGCGPILIFEPTGTPSIESALSAPTNKKRQVPERNEPIKKAKRGSKAK